MLPPPKKSTHTHMHTSCSTLHTWLVKENRTLITYILFIEIKPGRALCRIFNQRRFVQEFFFFYLHYSPSAFPFSIDLFSTLTQLLYKAVLSAASKFKYQSSLRSDNGSSLQVKAHCTFICYTQACDFNQCRSNNKTPKDFLFFPAFAAQRVTIFVHKAMWGKVEPYRAATPPPSAAK